MGTNTSQSISDDPCLSLTGRYNLPTAELQHLFSLTQLTELTLEAAVIGLTDPKIMQELQVPSSRLPKLVKFTIRAR